MSIKIIKNGSITIDSPYKIIPGSYSVTELADSASEYNLAEDRIAAALLQESKIIHKAEIEAKKIIDTANTEAVSSFDTKTQEGFQKGYEDGMLKAQNEMKNKLQELDSIRINAKKEYIELVKTSESDIIGLVMDISRKFLGDKIEEDKNIITNLAKETILRFTNATELTVRVSYQDYSYVLDNKSLIMSKMNSLDSLDIVNDDNLNPGSCIVESKDNSVDSSFDKRLENIQKTFEELLKY